MTDDTLLLTATFFAGAALGLFYFGGLWLTLQRIHRARRPGMLLLLSFLVRIAVVLPAFYVVMAGEWQRIATCLLGFLVVRFLMIQRIRPVRMSRPAHGRPMS